MGFIDKVCGKIGLIDPEDINDKRDSRDEDDDFEESDEMERGESLASNVVNFQAAASNAAMNNVAAYKMKVVVIEPKSFDDAQQVANCLRDKRPVVINFENTVDEDAKRITDFSAALRTASRKAPRTARCSSTRSPAIVVPAGDVTWSRSSAGCLPVSSTILAAPKSVCAANSSASLRGSPAATPPSASASMTRKAKAGPLPESPVTASIMDSSRHTAFPAAERIVRIFSS